MAEQNFLAANLRERASQIDPTKPGTGSIRQFLSSSMMKLGTTLLASGLEEEFDDPALGKAVTEIGDSAVGLINQRFWKSEYETFQQTYGVQYEAASRKIWDNYNAKENAYQLGADPVTGAPLDPFGPQAVQARTEMIQEAMEQVKQLDMQFMQNAARYAGNPMIGKMAADIMQSRSQSMNEMMGAYPAAINEAGSAAKLQGAAQQLSPEGMARKEKMAALDVRKAEAQTKKAELDVKKAEKGTEYDIFKNVPVSQMHTFLMDPKGGGPILNQYRIPAEAALTDKLIASNPDLALPTNADKLQQQLDLHRPEINRKAIGMAMINHLSGDKLELAKISHPQFFDAALDKEQQKVYRVKGNFSPSERRTFIEHEFGPQMLSALEGAARSVPFNSIDELLAEFESQVLQHEIDRIVDPNFKGSQKERTQLRSRARDYLLDNWDSVPFLKETYGGRARRKTHRGGLLSPEPWGRATFERHGIAGGPPKKKEELGKAQEAQLLDSNFVRLPGSKKQAKRLNQGKSPNRTLYDPIINENAKRFNVPAPLVKAVVAYESTFKPKAKSSAGAIGLMQLMPETAAGLGVADIMDPAENIRGGTQYLNQMYGMFGNWMSAIAAYNTGPENVRRHGHQVAGVTRVTVSYVENVVDNYIKLANPGPNDPIMKDYREWQKKRNQS